MKNNIGDIVEGEIVDFTHEGKGVLKVDNFIVFVDGGLIGDKVEVEISEVKKNFAQGFVTKLLEASKDRVKLDFEIEESRGGIPLIEYSYQKQLEWKREKVKTDLAKIAGLTDVNIKNTIGMDKPYRYRNHTQIAVGKKNGKTLIGFYEMNSNDIVDMKKSILQSELADRILDIIRRWMKEYNITSYNKRNKQGTLRHIGIRTNKDNEAMVILVTGSEKLLNKPKLIEALTKENVVSIYQNINKMNSPITYGREYKKIFGEDRILDNIGDYSFSLSPSSFFQTNRTQAEVLYTKAREYLELDKDDIVYDLYSGIGTISLYIADKAKMVYGVESLKQAVEDAEENAKRNSIENVEFIVGKAEVIFPELLEKGIKGNKVVVDPPRKGCEKELLEAIVELGPEKIAYVSCNPSSMARDVKFLIENGFEIKEVQPVDMFPHTGHIECVIGMQRKDT